MKLIEEKVLAQNCISVVKSATVECTEEEAEYVSYALEILAEVRKLANVDVDSADMTQLDYTVDGNNITVNILQGAMG